jgi:hypothetical protein
MMATRALSGDDEDSLIELHGPVYTGHAQADPTPRTSSPILSSALSRTT